MFCELPQDFLTLSRFNSRDGGNEGGRDHLVVLHTHLNLRREGGGREEGGREGGREGE